MRHLTRRPRPFILGLSAALGLALALVLVTLAAWADPIQNGTLAVYRAGWYSNASRSGPLTCAETCKKKASDSLAEHEASAEPAVRRAFVCRVPGRPEGDLLTWTYGSQFDSRPACYTVGLDLKGSYRDEYYCLCVTRRPLAGKAPRHGM